nr:calcium-binding protein [Ruegeria sp. PrR005]
MLSLGDGLFAFVNYTVTGGNVSVFDAEGWSYGWTRLFTEDGTGPTGPGAVQVQDGALLAWGVTGPLGDRDRTFQIRDLPDVLYGTEGDDTIELDAPAVLRTGAGDDALRGSAGNDVLDGGPGHDTLFGGDGDDLLRLGRGISVADGGTGTDMAHLDLFEGTYQEWETPEGFDIRTQFTLELDGTLIFQDGDTHLTLRNIEEFNINGYLVTYGSIVGRLFERPDDYVDLRFHGTLYGAGPGNDRVVGTEMNETIYGGIGNDTLLGRTGFDELHGGDGDDYIHGSDPASDPTSDLRDVIYAGDGNDTVYGGYGNDLIYGMDGDDVIAGGFGADELIGQNGNDVITGSAYSDLIFGNAGDDFVNGGFGHDRINGGSGADKFFHVGASGHGSDWVQDYNAAEGDVLLFGIGSATRDQFQVNFNHTANAAGERAGDEAVQEAFVIYRPTGQILWALVDGAGQSAINLQIGGDVFDLLA